MGCSHIVSKPSNFRPIRFCVEKVRGLYLAPPERAVVCNNSAPKPFRWTKSEDDILANIQHFCSRRNL